MKQLLPFLLFLLLIFIGCSSADLYQFNYSNDPDMQERMEKQYGDIPFWQDQGK